MGFYMGQIQIFYMKGNGKTMKRMDKGLINGQMGINM